jgi:hypothetical protein
VTNGEVQRVIERLEERGPSLDWEALGLLLELARRELQRLNPDADRTPCRFDIFSSAACKYGSRSCVEDHDSVESRGTE